MGLRQFGLAGIVAGTVFLGGNETNSQVADLPLPGYSRYESNIQHMHLFFDVSNFEPGNYMAFTETPKWCEVLGYFAVYQIRSGLTIPNQRLMPVNILRTGEYEIFVTGNNKTVKMEQTEGCKKTQFHLDKGDKIKFLKVNKIFAQTNPDTKPISVRSPAIILEPTQMPAK